jgi:hypothetical protein
MVRYCYLTTIFNFSRTVLATRTSRIGEYPEKNITL